MGSIYALLTALTWSIAVILFKRSGDDIHPMGLNNFKNVVALVLLAATLAIRPDSIPATIGWNEGALLLSGVFGIGVADSLYFHALNRLGPTREAIASCLYSPCVVALSYILLNETLGALDGLGALLIVVGVVLSVWAKSDSHATTRDLLLGTLYSAVSTVLMGVAIVAIKPILEETDVLWATTTRVVGGVAFLALWPLLDRSAQQPTWSAFIPQRAWRFAIPGSVIGTYVTLLFWIAGFKYAPANIAGLLNQMSTVFVVILAVALLGERLNARKTTAVLLAFSGTILVFFA